jgi:hypothetical protein
MEKLRKNVKDATFYAHAAAWIAIVALLVALLGSATSALVSHRAIRKVDVNAALGVQRRAILHRQDVKSCTSAHLQAAAFITFLNGSIKDSENLLESGALDKLGPTIKEAQLRGINRSRRLLVLLRMSDCTSVSPLTPKEKP